MCKREDKRPLLLNNYNLSRTETITTCELINTHTDKHGEDLKVSLPGKMMNLSSTLTSLVLEYF